MLCVQLVIHFQIFAYVDRTVRVWFKKRATNSLDPKRMKKSQIIRYPLATPNLSMNFMGAAMQFHFRFESWEMNIYPWRRKWDGNPGPTIVSRNT